MENEKRKDTERLKSEMDTVRDRLNETSKMNTLHFNSQDDTDQLRNDNSRLREELKLIETRFEVFNREMARLKKENQEYNALHKQLATENNRLKDIIQDRESVLDRFTQQLEKQTSDLGVKHEQSERILHQKEEEVQSLEKERSELQHQLQRNEQAMANLRKVSKKESERLREKVDV